MASEDAGVSSCHVARQPILNRANRIVGYQLMFRDTSSAGRAEIASEIGASSRVIINALANIGSETLLGEGFGLVSCDSNLAIADLLSDLSGARLVLQLPEMDVVSPAFQARCQELHADGVRFAFNDYCKRDNRTEMLPFASYAQDTRRL